MCVIISCHCPTLLFIYLLPRPLLLFVYGRRYIPPRAHPGCLDRLDAAPKTNTRGIHQRSLLFGPGQTYYKCRHMCKRRIIPPRCIPIPLAIGSNRLKVDTPKSSRKLTNVIYLDGGKCFKSYLMGKRKGWTLLP
jgi:hypothetical protein